MIFRNDCTLGLDVGIGSIGWIIVRQTETGMEIFSASVDGKPMKALGVRCFSVPENPKTKELLNKKRRSARGQRRVTRRRARRMGAIRSLLEAHGFTGVKDIRGLHQPEGEPQKNPWILRVESLTRVLDDREMPLVLLHIAKHRGFRSNSKRGKTDRDKETGQMLKAAGEFERRMNESGQNSVAVLLRDEPRKRNRAGADGQVVYERTILRKLLEKEAELIFTRQREMGNIKATPALQQAYADIAFLQRPLQSSADLVGWCRFIPKERRAPRLAPTSERFRLAAKLTTLKLTRQDPSRERRLHSKEIESILSLLGEKKSIKFTDIRKTLCLSEDWRFVGLAYGKTEKNPESVDAATRTGNCGAGTHSFWGALGQDSFNRLMRKRTQEGRLCLDMAAKIISDNNDLLAIKKQLENLPLHPEEITAIMEKVADGPGFTGTMHISLKAMEKIIPPMVAKRSYTEGCDDAGFDHAAAEINLQDIRNPVVRRILKEVKWQTRAIMRTFGIVPGRVHVELARDVGKGVEERKKIKIGIERRTKDKEKNRKNAAELLDITEEEVTEDLLMRYELWLQQGEKCAYYMLWKDSGGERFYGSNSNCQDGYISPDHLRAMQIDHILPRSRTQDNSFHNLCLCTPSANQAKGGQTPWEWIGQHNPQAWHEFEQWIECGGRPFSGFKKRNFLMKELDAEKSDRFCERNLNDTRYACRLSLRLMEKEYEHYCNGTDEREKIAMPMFHQDGTRIRRVLARPGGVTVWLRRAWGVEGLKKNANGKRVGDRHHALDAFIVACCTEGMLQKTTHIFQKAEKGLTMPPLPPPMPDCRNVMASALNNIFVSRAERGSTKGALHEETLRAIRKETDDQGNPVTMLYVRKVVTALTREDLKYIKDTGRKENPVKDALDKWLTSKEKWDERGKPKDAKPEMPYLEHRLKDGTTRKDYIRHVCIKSGLFTSGVKVPRGDSFAQASNGEMVRTDVFCKGGKYYLVPVYTWQIARGIIPDRVIQVRKTEDKWPTLDDSYAFCFSLIKDSYVRTEKKDGSVREGYFLSTDRSVATISLALPHDRDARPIRIGVQSLKIFYKFRVDRLGRLYKVKKEKRPV